MKNKNGLKILCILAGVLSVALAGTVFAFVFVSAGEPNTADAVSGSGGRHMSIGEGLTSSSSSPQTISSSVSSAPSAPVSSSLPESASAAPESATAPEPASTAPESVPTEEPVSASEPKSSSESVHVPNASSGQPENAGHGNENNFDTYDNEEQQQTDARWVLNTSSMKIHYPSCNQVKKIAPQNYETSNLSEEELIAAGYTTCGVCH